METQQAKQTPQPKPAPRSSSLPTGRTRHGQAAEAPASRDSANTARVPTYPAARYGQTSPSEPSGSGAPRKQDGDSAGRIPRSGSRHSPSWRQPPCQPARKGRGAGPQPIIAQRGALRRGGGAARRGVLSSAGAGRRRQGWLKCA